MIVALVGCERLAPARRAVLPSELSILAQQTDGAPISLLLGLRRNSRDQLDVRIADGAQIYDGRRVWSLEDADGGLAVVDRVSGDRVTLAAGASPRLLALHQRTVWIATGTEVRACSMKDGRCGTDAVPELPLDHPGPGAGFRVALEDGAIHLHLPQEPAPQGITLATGIARLLGVYWVRGGTGEADEVANRTFRGRARVHAPARAVTADGDLADWPGAAPLVVEAPWQIQSGKDGWSGARDGSFSVAAAWTADAVCLAGRVRDDAPTPDDRLTIRLDRVTRSLPLVEATGAEGALHLTWLGGTYEVCVPTSALPARDQLPFAVLYADADPGESTTVLTSAPDADGMPLGELQLSPPD